MGGNQSTPAPPSQTDEQEYFGVKITQNLMQELGGGLQGDGNNTNLPFDINKWREDNSVRQNELDSKIGSVKSRAGELLNLTNEKVSEMETQLFSSISKNAEGPCAEIQKELTFALKKSDLEYIKITNLELKDCLRHAIMTGARK